MSDSGYVPPTPDSVRVWRGFRLPELTIDQFCGKLGEVFVPATVKLQVQAGLQVYVPTVLAGVDRKPDSVPDETAILFWESQQTYWDAFKTLAVRAYTLTHNGVYTTSSPTSRADFPTPFDGTLEADRPVSLFENAADWMAGPVTHLVGGRPQAKDPGQFRADVGAVLREIQSDAALAGAIACAGDDYVVYWELGPLDASTPQLSSVLDLLRSVVEWHHVFTPVPTPLPVDLWDVWSGMDVKSGSSFNMQFDRRTRPLTVGGGA
jgi:hypothetical protein